MIKLFGYTFFKVRDIEDVNLDAYSVNVDGADYSVVNVAKLGLNCCLTVREDVDPDFLKSLENTYSLMTNATSETDLLSFVFNDITLLPIFSKNYHVTFYYLVKDELAFEHKLKT